MSPTKSIFQTWILSIATGLTWVIPATAQTVTPTVGEGNLATVVDNTGAFTVRGGTAQLNTLFHSFESFSPNNLDVHFQLDNTTQTNIENVVARVTGSELSFMNSAL
ncbi:MAG: hypothetical protein AB8B99_00565 [Phormidesmis sp.]